MPGDFGEDVAAIPVLPVDVSQEPPSDLGAYRAWLRAAVTAHDARTAATTALDGPR